LKKCILIITLIFANFLQAVDMSTDTEINRSLSKEKELSNSFSESKEKQSSSSIGNSKENSFSTTVNLSLILLDSINKNCVQNILSARDFNLSYHNSKSGVMNINKKEYLDAGAGASMRVKDLGGDERAIKEHIACLIDAGAILAQASSTFPKIANKTMTEDSLANALEKSVASGKNLKDFKIKQIVQNAKSQLKKDCIFYGSQESIVCGNVMLSLSSMTPNKVTYLNHSLFGEKDEVFGVATNYQVNLSDTASSEKSLTASSTNSEDTTMKKTSSDSKTTSDKQSVGIGKFIPN
jgi:hypothetical protein